MTLRSVTGLKTRFFAKMADNEGFPALTSSEAKVMRGVSCRSEPTFRAVNAFKMGPPD